MIVSSKKMDEVDKFVKKLNIDVKERNQKTTRMATLRRDLLLMSRDRLSVERSGIEQRIGNFNKKYISKLGELSQLMQTTGTTDRDESARLVREIKAG